MKWVELKNIRVPGKPESGLWTLVEPFIEAETLLMLKVVKGGRWSYSTRTPDGCGPDGDYASHLAREDLLVDDAPPGCLVAKVGGSTADNAHERFVVGSFAVYKVPTDKGGPLFLTINDTICGFDDNDGELDVEISTSAKP